MVAGISQQGGVLHLEKEGQVFLWIHRWETFTVWGWRVTKVLLFSRADVQLATKYRRDVLEHGGLSILPTTIKTQGKNGITLKEIVQDAEVVPQLCSFVPHSGCGAKGWHCHYNLSQQTELSALLSSYPAFPSQDNFN